jgi:hypothetical protein
VTYGKKSIFHIFYVFADLEHCKKVPDLIGSGFTKQQWKREYLKIGPIYLNLPQCSGTIPASVNYRTGMRHVLFINIPTYDSGEEFSALCAPEAAATDPLHAAGGQVKRLLPRNQFSRQLFSRHLITTHPFLVRHP